MDVLPIIECSIVIKECLYSVNTHNLHLVSFSLSLKSRYINTQLSLLWRSISRISCPSSSWVIPKKIRIISGFLHKLDWGQKAIFRTYCPPTHHCWTTQSSKIRKKSYAGQNWMIVIFYTVTKKVDSWSFFIRNE